MRAHCEQEGTFELFLLPLIEGHWLCGKVVRCSIDTINSSLGGLRKRPQLRIWPCGVDVADCKFDTMHIVRRIVAKTSKRSRVRDTCYVRFVFSYYTCYFLLSTMYSYKRSTSHEKIPFKKCLVHHGGLAVTVLDCWYEGRGFDPGCGISMEAKFKAGVQCDGSASYLRANWFLRVTVPKKSFTTTLRLVSDKTRKKKVYRQRRRLEILAPNTTTSWILKKSKFCIHYVASNE